MTSFFGISLLEYTSQRNAFSQLRQVGSESSLWGMSFFRTKKNHAGASSPQGCFSPSKGAKRGSFWKLFIQKVDIFTISLNEWYPGNYFTTRISAYKDCDKAQDWRQETTGIRVYLGESYSGDVVEHAAEMVSSFGSVCSSVPSIRNSLETCQTVT